MLRKTLPVALTAASLMLLLGSSVIVPGVAVHAAASGRDDDRSWLDKLLHRRRAVEASSLIPWSHASSRPDLGSGPGEGCYVWHDRNTVHVWVRGDDRRERHFEGWIEMRDGKIDNLSDDHTERDDEFRQVTGNRILFKLTAGAKPHGFRFNIKDGSYLVVQSDISGRRADQLYFGEAMAGSRGNPAVFRLKD